MLISEFLAKAFNDDGYVGTRCIGLSQSSLIKNDVKKPSEVLLLDKLFLEKLGVKVFGPKMIRVYPNIHGQCATYEIRVFSKNQLRLFSENVNLIEHKKRKLERFVREGGVAYHKPYKGSTVLQT